MDLNRALSVSKRGSVNVLLMVITYSKGYSHEVNIYTVLVCRLQLTLYNKSKYNKIR